MEFKPDLLKYQIMCTPSEKKWGVVVLYKDGAHEQSCAMIVEPTHTWNEVITNFIPWLVAQVQEKIELIPQEA